MPRKTLTILVTVNAPLLPTAKGLADGFSAYLASHGMGSLVDGFDGDLLDIRRPGQHCPAAAAARSRHAASPVVS